MNKCPCCSGQANFEFSKNLILPFDNKRLPFRAEYFFCPLCRHLFYITDKPFSDYLEHYKNKPSPDIGKISISDKKEVERCCDLIESSLKNEWKSIKSTLEIGAGDGAFLDILSSKEKETYFFDFSNDLTNRLSKYHKQYQPGHKFDFIAIRHVLEHMQDPLSELIAVREKYCKKNSIVFIEVPCWDFLDELTDSINAEHFHQFTTTSLASLISRSGFNVISLFTINKAGYSTTPNRRLGILIEQGFSTADHVIFHNPTAYIDYIYSKRENKINSILEHAKGNIAFHGASFILSDILLNTNIKNSLDKITLFDGNQSRKGETFFNFTIDHPTQSDVSKYSDIIIFSSYEREISEFWRTLGFTGKIHVFST